MPNPENTVQVAAQRAGESYLHTCELEPDAIRPATRVAVSFGMTLPEFFAAEQEGTVPGQEHLRREDDCGRTTYLAPDSSGEVVPPPLSI